MDTIWQISGGNTPVVAAAIHDGHRLRPEVERIMRLSDAERLREEDPFTAGWASVAPNRIIGLQSRFELDLNRPREKAVYMTPSDAWGLDVWRVPPGDSMLGHSLAQYDAFYDAVFDFFLDLERRYKRFLVLDLHSYNHRRLGPLAAPANAAENPEVNIGTGTMTNRALWATLIDGVIDDMRAFDYLGRNLDVRENIKFFGGHFARWTHQNFPKSACVLSIEFKKIFMDEWTGVPDPLQLDAIQRCLESIISNAIKQLILMPALDE